MLRTAFLCPLYDKSNHFELAVNLLKSKAELCITEDIHFIFSNTEQQDKFLNMIRNESYSENVKMFTIPPELDVYSAKVVVKKFFGLHELMSRYDYIILIDSEAKFIKKCDFGELAASIWDSRSMLASNISYDAFFVLRKCFLTMGIYNNPKLRHEMEDYKYNFWFNELQVYKCSYLPGFFAWLERFDKNKYLNEWSCFEYYMFFAYLCLEHDFHLLKYGQFSFLGGINECMNFFTPEKQREILDTMNLHWTSSEDVVTDNIYMRFHLDRIKGQKTRGIGWAERSLRKCERKRRIFLACEALHCAFLLDMYDFIYRALRKVKRIIWRIIA